MRLSVRAVRRCIFDAEEDLRFLSCAVKLEMRGFVSGVGTGVTRHASHKVSRKLKGDNRESSNMEGWARSLASPSGHRHPPHIISYPSSDADARARFRGAIRALQA